MVPDNDEMDTERVSPHLPTAPEGFGDNDDDCDDEDATFSPDTPRTDTDEDGFGTSDILLVRCASRHGAPEWRCDVALPRSTRAP